MAETMTLTKGTPEFMATLMSLQNNYRCLPKELFEPLRLPERRPQAIGR